MLLQGSLSIERLCQLVPVSRRSFYRSLKEQRPAEEETEVRSMIQQIALEHRRRYGYRRITAELRRRGMQVNHKRVAVMPISALAPACRVPDYAESSKVALPPPPFGASFRTSLKIEFGIIRPSIFSLLA